MECLEKKKNNLGADHPDTLGAINCFAALYDISQEGKYHAAAEQLNLVECLEKRRKTLAADHPNTLLAINNLAMLYSNQGNYDTVEPLHMVRADREGQSDSLLDPIICILLYSLKISPPYKRNTTITN